MNRLVTSVIFGLVTINTVIMADPTRPRLVVGIVVDQLRTDYVEYLSSLFGEKGFRRLMKDGKYIRNIDFRSEGIDAVSATAVAYTGAYPNANGVMGAACWSPEKKTPLRPLNDPSQVGNFTTETFSPSALRLSTVSDEVMIDGAGVSAVYSIAPDPQQAVIMAGHAGTSAVWINENTGKWATTAYYKDVPMPMSTRNYNSPLSVRIDTMAWRPLLPLDRYPGIPAQKKYYPFRYHFPTSDRSVYRMFASSPLVNNEVTDLAVDYISQLNLGNRGDAIDMINLGLTAAPYKYVKDGDFRLELEDTYIRLDGQIGRLLDVIDAKVGLDNTLVFVTSTGYYDDASADDPKYRIPSGEFSVKRALSLLNSYLSAKYGNGDYVDAYFDGHVYLDHKNIENAKLRPEDVAADARGFLCRMSGVSEAFTLTDILSPADNLETLRLAVDPKTCGDIILRFAPGWTVVDDSRYPTEKYPVRYSSPLTPAFLMGPSVDACVIDTPVDAAVLAPTVCGVMRIRSPNGASRRSL